MVTLVVLGIVLSFLCFIFQKSEPYRRENKRIKIRNIAVFILGLFLLSIVLVGMSANRGVGDVRSFIAFYNHVRNYSENPWDYTYELFAWITGAFLKVFPNTTFFEFRAALILAVWIGIYFFYKKYTYRFESLFFLYLLSGTFIHDGAQIKNFDAVAFLIYGLNFLIHTEKKYLGLYYMFAITAVFFHFSFFIYLFLPIVKLRWFQRIKKGIPILGGGVYVIFFIGGTALTDVILRALSYLPMMGKLNFYLTSYSGKRSLVLFLIYYIALYSLYRCRFGISLLDEKKAKLLNLTYDIWLLMGSMLPFLIYANAAYRLFRNLYIPIFIVISNYVVTIPRFSKKRVCVSGMILCFIFSIFIQPILFGQWIDTYQPLIDGDFFWK